MKVVRRISELRRALEPHRREGRSIGFVPTMGALHEGHLSLVRMARAADDVVVVSVFVNPLQFGPGEDYERYPRDPEGDLELLRGERADVAFLPPVEEMYPPGATTRVTVGPLGEVFEGADRPGHFDGVCTVVAKLFNAVQPRRAYFGQKDAQQVAVIRRMVADLDFPVEVVVGPTVREADGLAMSSRNAYLGQRERAEAVALHEALQAGARAYASGRDPARAEAAMAEVLSRHPLVVPSYARAVDPDTFGDPRPGGPVLLIVAARVGQTRLIDNMLVE